jgi:hypothetical protein
MPSPFPKSLLRRLRAKGIFLSQGPAGLSCEVEEPISLKMRSTDLPFPTVVFVWLWVIWPCTLGELQWYMVYFVVVQQYVHPLSHDDVWKLSILSHINKCHRHAQWPGSLHTPLECWPCTRHVPAETMQKRCLYGDMEILWLCVCGRYLNPSQLAVILGNNMKPCFQQYQHYFQQ